MAITTEYSVDKINKDIIELFAVGNLNIINMEAPISHSETKIKKTGPHLKSNEKAVKSVLSVLNVNLVTLANNHILDYAVQGLRDTITFCHQNGIETVGAGENLHEASQTLYKWITEDTKIAIINFAENEWASATNNSAGSNPMDVIDNYNQIRKAKSQANYVVVIIHGGNEYYNLPSPRMRKQYRFYVDAGADIIIGHHTHCISGYEIYKNVPIIYSLGNFLFTKENVHEEWYIGMLLELNINKAKFETTLHFTRQNRKNNAIDFVSEAEKQIFINAINQKREIIEEEKAIEFYWCNYVMSNKKKYLTYWSPISFVKNKYLKYFLRKTGLTMLNEEGISIYKNLIKCEAHQEVTLKTFNQYLEKDENSYTS